MVEMLMAAMGFLGYFLPSFVGSSRRHHNQLAIVMLNLFLGWTGVGWVLAVWACTATQQTSGRTIR